MTDTCSITDSSGCTDTPLADQAKPTEPMAVCPILLQENGRPLLQEQTDAQRAAGRRAGYIVLE